MKSCRERSKDEFQKNVVFYKIKNHFHGFLENRIIGHLEDYLLNQKTDDIRDNHLSIYSDQKTTGGKGFGTKYIDPAAMDETKNLLGEN
jgi:hypothetical protein